EPAANPPSSQPATSLSPRWPSIFPKPPVTQPLVVIPRTLRPPPHRIPLQNTLVTDEQIGQAIRAGVDIFLSQFADGQLKHSPSDSRYAGIDFLCVYALMQCGQAINDERLDVRGKLMKDLLAKMKQLPPHASCETYTRGIRATALAVYNRPEDRQALKADLQWLLNAPNDGGYTYSANSHGNSDNSNSQYGLLGVWAAAEVGVEVPQTFWTRVQRYWQNCQLSSGQWDYTTNTQGAGRLSMTAAGLTSLFVTHDYLDAPLFGKEVGRPPFSKSLAAGLDYLETADNCLDIGTRYPGYTLYGLERVGLASGFKYFGSHDWYPELAASILIPPNAMLNPKTLDNLRDNAANQLSADDLIDTAFSLLFLARGRHPILMNKLRFDGSWANRPRDVANLTRFASRELERPLNWQVVPLNRDWNDWLDSPILYIASHQPQKLTDAHLAKLRSFVEAGGLIYSQADGGSPSFTTFITDLGRKLFPAYEWKDLPATHSIYTLNYKIDAPPPLRCLTNANRILMLHSPNDLAQHWQLRAEKTKRPSFELGVNLFIYAAGKTDLRNRLNSLYLPPLAVDPTFRIRVARVEYRGPWDPEPHAFVRFSRWLEYQTAYRLQISPVFIEHLRPAFWPIAHMTGTAQFTPSETQLASLRRYVEDGGVLLIDSCGGNPEFDQSIAALLQRAFPNLKPTPLPPDHPLFTAKAPGMDPLPTPRLRPGSHQLLPKIQILSAGKGHILYSPLDLTTALLGTNTHGIQGYHPTYARSLLKNLLLWTTDGAKDTIN
ncbi:MAG: DUF4159 domain-containing protein, partial [Planctomycetota bacterium]|nr:DUF4159 domain-containing protein [Planctomycetota bacterium]